MGVCTHALQSFIPKNQSFHFFFKTKPKKKKHINSRSVAFLSLIFYCFQKDVVGRDTGTDAMAGVLASVDVAATSVGFPIRNMHTVSELAHTGING